MAVGLMPVVQKPVSLQPVIRLPKVNLKRLRVDMSFGRCPMTASRLPSPVIRLTADPYLADVSSSSNSSSEENEAVEVKRRKLDPDYQPSTASESPLTTPVSSQNVSEEEPDESNSEDTESWQPSETTSPEIISSSEED
jgi:hypothetical protein